ncbi:MAG: ATP-binding cassette domain-containing protein [Candidatus Aegiribacteria sp.]|nr:ATP-binding cassette domain-containing protein [Candidatus Aegiribacteria sp.]
MAPYISIGGYSDPPRIPHLSLEVNHSELVALIGGPGSGKSDLMKCLAGIRKPVRDSIRIMGAKPGTMRSRDRSVFVFQNFNYAPDIFILTQLQQRISLIRGVPSRDVKDDVRDWCERMELQDVCLKYPDKLNLSQLQLFSLAPVSLTSPSVVILDEPLRNVSASSVDSALALILPALENAAVLALVQKMSPLLEKADRIETLR